MSGRKGMLHYRVEIKQEAVRLVLEEHCSYAEVAARLEIRKAARIEAWVRMYRRKGSCPFINRLEGRRKRKRSRGNWNACGWRTHC